MPSKPRRAGPTKKASEALDSGARPVSVRVLGLGINCSSAHASPMTCTILKLIQILVSEIKSKEVKTDLISD